jgi:MFS family permease
MRSVVEPPGAEFRRDRLTWIAYALLAWFAYLQAAPGLVIGHLRDELDLSYSTGGLHVAAFAAGSLVAGVISARLECALGRRALFWSAAALMGAGAIGLAAGRIAEVTVGSLLVMGVAAACCSSRSRLRSPTTTASAARSRWPRPTWRPAPPTSR